MFVEQRLQEMFDVCCVEKSLRFRHFFLYHAKSAQETIARSKRNSRRKAKLQRLEKQLKRLKNEEEALILRK